MKKIVLLILFYPTILKAQIISILPQNEAGEIVFSEVVKCDSVKKDELFIRAKTFFANTFVSSKEVIQFEDKESGQIIGKGLSSIESGLLLLKMHFTIKVTCKENRYKYEIYNFSFTSTPSYPHLPNGMTFYPSQWFDSTEYYKGNGKPKQRCENFKDKFVGEIEVLKNLLANEMIKPKEIKKEDW